MAMSEGQNGTGGTYLRTYISIYIHIYRYISVWRGLLKCAASWWAYYLSSHAMELVTKPAIPLTSPVAVYSSLLLFAVMLTLSPFVTVAATAAAVLLGSFFWLLLLVTCYPCNARLLIILLSVLDMLMHPPSFNSLQELKEPP